MVALVGNTKPCEQRRASVEPTQGSWKVSGLACALTDLQAPMTVTAQFAIASAIPVPSLKEGTLALLGLLAGVLGLWRLRRRGNAM